MIHPTMTKPINRQRTDMRIRLHEKFDWKVPWKRAMQAFTVGDHTMKREAGEEAIRQGKGREIKPPRKGENGDVRSQD
jgi:hypothetical protein